MQSYNISTTRIEELLKAERKLQALESGGVDNWSGYEDAMEDLFKEEQIEEVYRGFIEELQCNVLVDNIDVDYPVSMEAGHSVTLTQEGEKVVMGLLKNLVKDINSLIVEEVNNT